MREPDDITGPDSAELQEADLERLAGGTGPLPSNIVIINHLPPHHP